MAQYIEKESLYQKLHEAGGCAAPKGSWSEGWDKAIDEAIRLLNEMPTSDVVPKSEAEKLKSDLLVWKQNRFNIFQRLECYEMTRQKIAREIFEEIYEDCFDQFGYINYEALAELKKKYTEGDNG